MLVDWANGGIPMAPEISRTLEPNDLRRFGPATKHTLPQSQQVDTFHFANVAFEQKNLPNKLNPEPLRPQRMQN
jgi:hypothetical protein